ncbi:MAG TPA: EscU/YscU/HrcU family type III secretion system export apparatus switch protein [Candidatus Baltobacteraceae bacterium]
MAEEKQFDATQSRIDRARREGDMPRSSEITAAAAFGCGLLAMLAVLPIITQQARSAFVFAASSEQSDGSALAAILACSLVPMLGGIAGSVVSSLVQSRGLTFRAPKLDLARLNPVEGFKRMFSRDACIGAAKASVAATVATLAMVPPLHGLFAVSATPAALVPLVFAALEAVGVSAVVIGLAFGSIDFLVEQRKWRRRLRMNFDEIKRDAKQNEGDPIARSRRKQAHRALVRGSITRLRDAAFVVTNPTHVAIALEYHPPEVEVPRVLIRAIDEGAQLVKQRARELKVPIVENIALARLLLASTEVDSYIPRESYVAVAQIVAALISSKALA